MPLVQFFIGSFIQCFHLKPCFKHFKYLLKCLLQLFTLHSQNLIIFTKLTFTLLFYKNGWTFLVVIYFPYFSHGLIFTIIIATVDGIVDEEVRPEDFEEPGDFVEPEKQPLDHDLKPFLCMSYGTLLCCILIMLNR